ncbi:MAG: type I-C CRISPR-associated protein Cas8c/Csd1 [Thermodesulfobacteriota bacterium]|nr:type I-C CRISPR-associated protein Cas8c/Csd1 [Thermodesulfobacteriota bacterium]
MILRALKDLADREGLLKNPDYEPVSVGYLVKVGKEGRFLGFISNKETVQGKKGKKLNVKKFLVPVRSSRTSQDWPEFLVDKGEYVFGWPVDEKDGKKIKRAKKRHMLFGDLAGKAYEDTSHDEGIGAVLDLLQKHESGTLNITKPEGWHNEDLFGFIYDRDVDLLVSSRPSVSSYWAGIRFFRVQMVLPEEAVVAQCAASGEVGQTIRLHPAVKGIPPIADTKGGVPLTSINADAFESYELKALSCVPISPKIADGYGKALERLLSPAYPSPIDGSPMPKRNVRLSNDTIVVYWSKEESEFLNFFSDAVEANPEAVEAVYESAWKGRHVPLDNPTAFYALTLSGAQGRATIRGWFESTVKDVAANVRQHFEDLKIVYPSNADGQLSPLKRLLRSTVSSKVDNPDKQIHPNLAKDMFEAIVKGYPYPRIILDAVIRRTCAEQGNERQNVTPERAALIKAFLVRGKRFNQVPNNIPEVKIMLDKECNSTAYRLGRLFAVLERLQKVATGANTTIRNRYYGSASATPVVVFAQLLRKAPHHLAKRDDAPFYEKLIQEILSPLTPKNAFPSTLTLEEQGVFALGYYHQRQDLFPSSTKTTKQEG